MDLKDFDFDSPDYEKSLQELREYMAKQGKDLDEILEKASLHFRGDKPPIRTRNLTKEEIDIIIQEENEAFEEGEDYF